MYSEKDKIMIGDLHDSKKGIKKSCGFLRHKGGTLHLCQKGKRNGQVLDYQGLVHLNVMAESKGFEPSKPRLRFTRFPVTLRVSRDSSLLNNSCGADGRNRTGTVYSTAGF